jgi:tetratricopeptide (TPR) repeat protein
MLGPRTDNSVTDSQNVSQVGHNSGTIQIGLTFQEHEQNVRDRLAELRIDLERAHGAERAVLQSQVDAAQASLSNLQADYEKNVAELADLKVTLSRYDNVLDRTKHEAADAALDRGDRTLARALLGELSAKARARREDASTEEADLEYKLGLIAETEIRWHDAATHFATAARLNPGFDTLKKAWEHAWRAGDYPAAFRLGEDLLAWARAQGTQEQLAAALNEHALTLHAQGSYPEAEALHREALEIDRATIRTNHPDYAIRLNNLAMVVQAQGRHPEAEALEIDRATIGTNHPNYATHLNNLAGVVQAQERYPAARGHYAKALAILRDKLGDGHPNTKAGARNYLDLLQKQFPGDPEISALVALAAP